MNRQERVNCASFAAILVALLLLAGSYLQPATASPAAPVASATATAQQATSEPAESDQEPSGVRGLTIAELHADAKSAFDSLPTAAPSGPYTMIPEYAASYDGAAPSFPATYFTLESSNFPGVFHVFRMVAAQRA